MILHCSLEIFRIKLSWAPPSFKYWLNLSSSRTKCIVITIGSCGGSLSTSRCSTNFRLPRNFSSRNSDTQFSVRFKLNFKKRWEIKKKFWMWKLNENWEYRVHLLIYRYRHIRMFPAFIGMMPLIAPIRVKLNLKSLSRRPSWAAELAAII